MKGSKEETPVKYKSKSIEETYQIARDFASKLKKGDVLRFEGDLGAGKTTFIKGLALGLGLDNEDEVKSPTFVIMHVYRTAIPVHHFDLYRLEGDLDMASIGLDEFLGDENAITCVEWAEKAPDAFPAHSYRIKMKFISDKEREIIIE